MKDLETVLKSCDIHFDKNSECRGCAYNMGFDFNCHRILVNDLRYHVERLNKENKKLEERNKLLNKIVNETVNLCNNLIEENEKFEKQIDQIDK